MATLTLYVDSVPHNISIQSHLSAFEEFVEELNEKLADLDLPLLVAWQVTPSPVPPWNGGPSGGPSEDPIEGYASFTIQRIPHPTVKPLTAAIYNRGLGGEYYQNNADLNSIIMDSRYIDFNNASNDRSNPPVPQSFKVVGAFTPTYGVTQLDLSDLLPFPSRAETISLAKGNVYLYDPRFDAHVVAIRSTRARWVTLGLGNNSPYKFVSFDGNEWNGKGRKGPLNGTWETAGVDNNSFGNQNGGQFFMADDSIHYFLVMERTEHGFPDPARNAEFELSISAWTFYQRSTLFDVTSAGGDDYNVTFSSWASSVRFDTLQHNYYGAYIRIPPKSYDRTYVAIMPLSTIVPDDVWFGLADTFLTVDDGMPFTNIPAVQGSSGSGYREFTFTIPANKATLLWVRGVGTQFGVQLRRL